MGKKRKRTNSSLKVKLAGVAVLAVAAIGASGYAMVSHNSSAVAAKDEYSGFTPAPVQSRTFMTAVSFLGDSYTSGDGAQPRSSRWTTVLSANRNWVEQNVGAGGTGYATAGRMEGGAPYTARLSGATAPETKVVIVSGGRNDLSDKIPTDDIESSIVQTYTELRKSLPTARIIALSPIWDDDPTPAGLAEIGASVKAAVESVGGEYIDLGEPFEGRPELMSQDGVHPNDVGYKFLAEKIDAALPKDLP